MKKFISSLLIIAFMFSLIPKDIDYVKANEMIQQTYQANMKETQNTNNSDDNDSKYKSDRSTGYIIKYKDADGKKKGKDKILKKGGKVKKEFNKINAISVQMNEETLSELKNDAEVELIEQDYEVQVQSDVVPWGIQKINAPVAHQQSVTGKGIKVAVFDTGISNHPDIDIAGGISFIDGDYTYSDTNGHGTHVAGIIGALANDEGLIGTSPAVSLYAVKVINSNGTGSYSDIIAGLEWAIDNGIDIVNMSFGGREYSAILEQAINKAYENNILLFASTGNDGQNSITYPAKYKSVIAVGAMDRSGVRAPFSNTGPELELMAPGVSINSTSNNGLYKTMSGTSMAAPHAAGAAALIWSKNPNVSNTVIRGLMGYSALGLGNDGDFYGNGLVDVLNALNIYDEYVASPQDMDNDGENKDKKKIQPKTWESKEIKNLNKKGSSSVEINHGDTFSLASYLQVNTDVSGAIETAEDVDFFMFTAPVSGNYTIETTGTTDTYGYLYNSSESELAYNDDDGADSNFRISYSLTAGQTYYIKVRHYSSSGTGSYVLRATAPTPTDDYGNNLSAARWIQVNTDVPGSIETQGDEDYFAFTAPTTGTYVIETTGNIDSYGNLYNSSQSELTYNDDDGADSNFRISYSLSANQTYYVKVRHYSSSGTGSYVLRVTAPTPADDYGNSFSAARWIQVDTNVSGSIEYSGDEDYFAFTAPNSGTYTIETTGGIDNYGYLYNSGQSELASNDDDGIDNNFRISYSLTAGQTYYIKVRHYSSSGTGSYVLRITAPVPSDDHGNAMSSATNIYVNSPLSGSINYAGDEDYFRFTPTVSGSYLISTSGSTDTYGQLYNSNGVEIASNDDSNGTNFTLNQTLTANQTYYIKVRHFSSSGTGAYSINITLGQLPDLIVTNISWSPANPSAGSAVIFSATIKNQGLGSTPSGVAHRVAFLLSGGGTIAQSDNYTSAIAPGSSITVTANSGAWTAVEGTNTIIALVDDNASISESDESNNAAISNLSVINNDTDGDGIPNSVETSGIPIGYGGRYITTVYLDPNNKDTDGDGMDDGVELIERKYYVLDSNSNIWYYEVADNPASSIKGSIVRPEGINVNLDTLFNYTDETIDTYKSNITTARQYLLSYEVYIDKLEGYYAELSSTAGKEQLDDYILEVNTLIGSLQAMDEVSAVAILSSDNVDYGTIAWVEGSSGYFAYVGAGDTNIADTGPSYALFGTLVHNKVRDRFKAYYGSYGANSNKAIPGVWSRLFPDLVYHNEDEDTAKIYELKPISYSKQNSNRKYLKAKAQLEKYIDKYDPAYKITTSKGTDWPDPSNIIIPLLDSSFRNRVVWLRTFEDQPGLIYYQEVRKKDPLTQYAPAHQTVKDQKGNEYVVIAEDRQYGLVLVAAGGLIIMGSLAGDVVTFGASVADDPASFAAGLALIERGLALSY